MEVPPKSGKETKYFDEATTLPALRIRISHGFARDGLSVMLYMQTYAAGQQQTTKSRVKKQISTI